MKKNASISLKHTKAQWPVSLEELKERRDQNGHDQGMHLGMLCVGLFVFLAANAPLIDWIENNEVAKWVPFLSMVILFVALFGSLGLMIWIAQRYTRAYDLVCPSCGKNLHRNQLMPVAVATGHCGHCGVQLVKDHPSRHLADCGNR